jgi:hypothetical protein
VTVTRLVGGLTPGDGSDPRTFPAIWNDTADVIDDIRRGYVLVDTLYYTSSGTFDKADVPWLRAIRVKVQGAGGGGAGAVATGVGQVSGGGSGGGGGYAEKFITNIAGLSSSVTVTRGAGGSGGAGSGGTGGSSTFDTVTGAGGEGGVSNSAQIPSNTFGDGGSGGAGSGGDLNVNGSGGLSFFAPQTDRIYFRGAGGSQLGGGLRQLVTGSATNGLAGLLYGGGGGAAANPPSQSARNGGAGGNGIVIVELFA